MIATRLLQYHGPLEPVNCTDHLVSAALYHHLFIASHIITQSNASCNAPLMNTGFQGLSRIWLVCSIDDGHKGVLPRIFWQ